MVSRSKEGKLMIGVNIDFSGMAGYIGVIKGVANKSQMYADTMVRAAAETGKREFNVAADIIAVGGSTTALEHVYEPGMAGNPGARLWDVRVSGHDGQRGGKRDIFYVFTPSKIKPENTPESTGIPANEFPKGLRPQSRVPFWNRAMVLETGMQVVIRPRWAKKIFVPNWQQNLGTPNKVPASANPKFYFTDKPTTFKPTKYMGNFAGFWAMWWEQNADRVLQQSTKPIEDSIPRVVTKASKQFSRYKANRSIELFVRQGEQAAERIIDTELRSRNYGV